LILTIQEIHKNWYTTNNYEFHGEPEEKLRYYVLHEEPEEWFILLGKLTMKYMHSQW
jgi:hypothetical protein